MGHINVLIVDDDQTIRELLAIALSVEEGIGEIKVAADGLEALRMCQEFRPDIVVLDYWMPFMDGERAASAIRQLHPRARIVSFSAALDDKPEWADDHFVKGEMIDLDVLQR